jgi:hypothetical protein
MNCLGGQKLISQSYPLSPVVLPLNQLLIGLVMISLGVILLTGIMPASPSTNRTTFACLLTGSPRAILGYGHFSLTKGFHLI